MISRSARDGCFCIRKENVLGLDVVMIDSQVRDEAGCEDSGAVEASECIFAKYQARVMKATVHTTHPTTKQVFPKICNAANWVDSNSVFSTRNSNIPTKNRAAPSIPYFRSALHNANSLFFAESFLCSTDEELSAVDVIVKMNNQAMTMNRIQVNYVTGDVLYITAHFICSVFCIPHHHLWAFWTLYSPACTPAPTTLMPKRSKTIPHLPQTAMPRSEEREKHQMMLS
jgi:hypothetical protein